MEIDTSTALSAVSTSIQNNHSSSTQQGTNMQTFTIDMTGAKIKLSGDLTIGQTMQIDQNVFSSVTPQVISNMQSNATQALQAALDQSAKAKNDIGSTGNASANNASKIKTALTVAVNNSITQDNVNNIMQQLVDVQTMTVKMANMDIEARNITLTQSMIIKQVATNIINSVIANTNKILSDQGAGISVTQKGDAATSGLGDMWASLMNTISSIFQGYTYIVIAIVCLLCIAVIGAAMLLLSPAGQRAVNKGTNVAASRAKFL